MVKLWELLKRIMLNFTSIMASPLIRIRLLGCMVCCSWNNTTLSTRKVSSLKERSSQISAKCRTIHKIFHCAFSYPCLLISRRFLIRASHHCPFVYNGFYHWLYIIINSINLWGWCAWFTRIHLSLATQHHYYHNYYNYYFTHLSTLKY